MSDINSRLTAIEKECAADDAGNWWMYETQGELMAALPPGAAPEMLADSFAKPDLQDAIDRTTQARRPDPRNRQRPH